MTLQRRLALTLLISAVPLLVAVAWIRTEIASRSDVQILRDTVLSRAAAFGRERCELAPERFPEPPPGPPRFEPGGGPGRRPFGRGGEPPEPGMDPRRGPRMRPGILPRPLQTFLYDSQFQSQSPFAPPFPADLRDELAAGSETASHRLSMKALPAPPGSDGLESTSIDVVEVAVRTGWSEGPCAIILARRMGPPASAASWDLIAGALPLLGGLIAAVWVASGPLVRRVRVLTAAVRKSAEAHYQVPIPERGRDEITDLARAFNEAGAEVRAHVATLERRDRTLREFLANTTHDVMIPLTVLQGHLSTLQRNTTEGQQSDPAVLVSALQEAQYMSSILQNLGAAAKLDAPEQFVQRHPVDLNALVERVVERHRPVARPAGVDIDFAVPQEHITIEGDVTLFEQAVSNIVHNAVRYNHSGGHVAVVLDGAGDGAQRFRLRVLDDGPGVSDEALAKLTERRYRDDSARQRDPNGLGLGLSIAREVADRHGIQLSIGRSEQGGLEVELRS